MTEWSKADNRESCAIVAPLAVPSDAKPRRANFHGGWAVAYDKPGAPGTQPTGHRCETCGRGAFGIAGAGTFADDSGFANAGHIIRWSDGSRMSYSGSGYGGQWLANVEISGQRCLYQVWSYLGEEHLLELVNSLRFVE